MSPQSGSSDYETPVSPTGVSSLGLSQREPGCVTVLARAVPALWKPIFSYS
jgi:hypothetical protein